MAHARRWAAGGKGGRSRTGILLALASAVAPVIILAGCGSRPDALPGTVAVAGVVTFDGRPLEKGTVRFAPESGGQPATGAIIAGRFQMHTTRSSPGVLRGRYRVSVVSEKENAAPDLPAGVPPDPNNLPKPESLIPLRYSDATTSGLTVEIVGPVPDLAFSLEAR